MYFFWTSCHRQVHTGGRASERLHVRNALQKERLMFAVMPLAVFSTKVSYER